MSSSRVRVFVAIELPKAVRSELARLMAVVDALGVRGVRTMRPEGLHLTLKFLGDVDASTLTDIKRAMARAVVSSQPFDLALGDTGVFPNSAAPRVLWAGVKGDMHSLRALQARVEVEFETLGYGKDRRGFNPHLTVARIRDTVAAADRRRAVHALASTELDRLAIRVESISLMESTLHPDGAVYTQLHTVALGT